MKVIFLENLPDIARYWDIKDIKNWFFRNFLLPNWIAIPASEKMIKETESLRMEQIKLEKERNKIIIAQKENINWATIEFTSKSDWTNLYAAISEKDIIQKLNKQYKIDLDKKAITHTKIKTIWKHLIEVRLNKNTIIKITVKIIWEQLKNIKK